MLVCNGAVIMLKPHQERDIHPPGDLRIGRNKGLDSLRSEFSC
jgi:hypothetical protein